jgi:hypothetical protein
MIRKLPKNGSTRRKRAFAWLPVRTDDGYRLWFEYYTQVEQYWSYKNMWVLHECLYEGPAIERTNGNKYWYLNGEDLTEEEFNERMAPTVEMTMAQINEALGKNVKVVK